MFKAHKLDRTADSLENLHKLCLQEFPEYRQEILQLLRHVDFIEMLEDYAYCQKSLLNPNQLTMNRATYEQLMVELKQEMKLFIMTHIHQWD